MPVVREMTPRCFCFSVEVADGGWHGTYGWSNKPLPLTRKMPSRLFKYRWASLASKEGALSKKYIHTQSPYYYLKLALEGIFLYKYDWHLVLKVIISTTRGRPPSTGQGCTCWGIRGWVCKGVDTKMMTLTPKNLMSPANITTVNINHIIKETIIWHICTCMNTDCNLYSYTMRSFHLVKQHNPSKSKESIIP